jgi:hypothetical protein
MLAFTSRNNQQLHSDSRIGAGRPGPSYFDEIKNCPPPDNKITTPGGVRRVIVQRMDTTHGIAKAFKDLKYGCITTMLSGLHGRPAMYDICSNKSIERAHCEGSGQIAAHCRLVSPWARSSIQCQQPRHTSHEDILECSEATQTSPGYCRFKRLLAEWFSRDMSRQFTGTRYWSQWYFSCITHVASSINARNRGFLRHTSLD